MLKPASLFLCVPLLVATAAGAQKAPDSTHPLAACGDEKVSFSVSRGPIGDTATAPDPGKATIYFIELFNLSDKGRFNRPTIRHAIDGAWIGTTQGFTYVSASVEPGRHHLCSWWQARGSTSDQVSLNNVDAVAGQRYYFRVQIIVPGGADLSGPRSIDLELISEDEGRFLVSRAAQAISKKKN